MALILKIELPTLNLQKSMRFVPEQSVADAVKSIIEKTDQGGEDHGLLGEVSGTMLWLTDERSLGSYDLETNDVLIFKKKHQMVKVKLLDDSVKTFLLSTAAPCGELVIEIGKHMSIKRPEEFALQLEVSTEIGWMSNDKNLVEEGWTEGAIVLFKKKFFFSDQYVDKDDPMALHLLYLQIRRSILDGENPVSKNEAIQLTAMMLQIEHNDFSPKSAASLDFKNVLPKPMQKDKTMDKDITKAWRALAGTSDLNAKYRYVQFCRSLKTYGITSFLVAVEEQNKANKNAKKAKAMSLLFGITRDRVMFMDPETKEVKLREVAPDDPRAGEPMAWKLTKIKRWAAAPQSNSITFDFGDHESNYLVMKTKECSKISDLVAGYIDITVKARKDAARHAEGQSTGIAYISSVQRPRGSAKIGYSSVSVADGAAVSVGGGLGGPRSYTIRGGGKHPPIVDARSAVGAMISLYDDFDNPGYKVPATQTFDDFNAQVQKSMNAVAKGVRDLAGLKTFTRETVDLPMRQLGLDSEKLILACRNAALTSVEGVNDDLLNVSRVVAGTLKDLLGVVDWAANDQSIDLADAIQVAKKNYDASIQALKAVRQDGSFKVNNSSSLILEAGKAVAHAIDMIQAECNGIAELDNPSKALQAMGRSVELASSSLANAMLHPDPRRDIRKANQTGAKAVSKFQEMARAANLSEEQIAMLLEAAELVQNSFALLNDGIEASEIDPGELPDIGNSSEVMVAALERIRSGEANRASIIQATKDVASSSNTTVIAAQAIARIVDDTGRARLLGVSKICAESVQELVEAAKDFTSDMGNEEKYERLSTVAGKMITTGSQLADETRRMLVMTQVRAHAKDGAAAAISMIEATRSALQSVTEPSARQAFQKAAEEAAIAVKQCVSSVKSLVRNSADIAVQDETIAHSQVMAAQSMSLVATSRRLNVKVGDMLAKADLKDCGQHVADSMNKLLNSCRNATSTLEQEMDDAIESTETTSSELDAIEALIQSGLVSTDTTRNDALALLSHATKLMADQNNLLRAAALTRPHNAGSVATNFSSSLAQVASATKAVVSASRDRNIRFKALEAARALNSRTARAIECAKAVAAEGGEKNAQPSQIRALINGSRGVQEGISALVAAARGLDTSDVDAAAAAIKEHASKIAQPVDASGKSLGNAVQDLIVAVRATSGAVQQVVAAANGSGNFGSAAKITASTVPALVSSVNQVGALLEDSDRRQLFADAEHVTAVAGSILRVALASAATQDETNRDNLQGTSRMFGDAITSMMATLGHDEDDGVEQALQMIMDATGELERVAEHIAPAGVSVGASVANVLSEVRNLAGSSTQVVAASKATATRLGKTARTVAETVQTIITSSLNAVKATPSSSPPEFVKLTSVVTGLTRQLVANAADVKKVNVIARGLAVSTAKLMQSAKAASVTLGGQQKEQLEGAARSLAETTAKLAQGARAVQGNQPGAAGILAGAAGEMDSATMRILKAVSTSEGESDASSDPAHQQRVIENARSLATTTAHLLRAAESSLKRKGEESAQRELATASDHMIESIQALTKACSRLQPGAAEFDTASERIENSLGDLEAASIGAAVGSFEPVATSATHQQCQEELVVLAKAIAGDLSETMSASRVQSSSKLGHTALQVGEHVSQLVSTTLAACSTTSDQDLQSNLLHVAKAVAEALLGLLTSARNATSTGKRDDNKSVGQQAQSCTAALGQLVNTLQSGVVLLRDMDESLGMVDAAVKAADGTVKPGSYQGAKDSLSDLCQHVASTVQRLVSTDKGNLVQLGVLTREVAQDMGPLVAAALLASSSAPADLPDLAKSLKAAGKTVAVSCSGLISAAKSLAEDPRNTKLKSAFHLSLGVVSTSLGALLEHAKRGAVGEQQCDQAMEIVSTTISDLGTAILFAAAGQLDISDDDKATVENDLTPEGSGRRLIAAAQLLAGNSQRVVAATKSGDMLSFSSSALALANVVHAMSGSTKVLSSLNADISSQQQMLQSAKSVAQSAQGLILSSKDAVRSPDDGSVMRAISASSATVAEAIQSLLGLAQAHSTDTKGIASLVNAIHSLQDLVSQTAESDQEGHNDMPAGHDSKLSARAIDIVQSCRDVSRTVVSLRQAISNSDGKATSAASTDARNATEMMLVRALGAAISTAPDQASRSTVVSAARNCAQGMVQLLATCKDQATTGVAAGQVIQASDKMADLVQAVVTGAKVLPGGAGLSLQVDSGGDLESKASSELEAAASAIFRAMEVLLETQARKPRIPSVNIDTTGVTEQLLAAAIALAQATHKLVISAVLCQQERLDNQVANPQVYNKDPMWANGLISAGKQVAASTQQLVKSATRTVDGSAETEELPAVAKTVAEATAHLVSATRAKSAEHSKATGELSISAKAVAKATADLVAAANEAAQIKEEEELQDEAATMTGSTVAKIEQHMRVLRAERELEKARREMSGLNKSRYSEKRG